MCRFFDLQRACVACERAAARVCNAESQTGSHVKKIKTRAREGHMQAKLLEERHSTQESRGQPWTSPLQLKAMLLGLLGLIFAHPKQSQRSPRCHRHAGLL
jgi:hypothetical protein